MTTTEAETRTQAAAATEAERTTESPAEGRGSLRASLSHGLRTRLSWLPASLRTRILTWFIGALALAIASSVFVTYRVLLIQLDQRIDSELAQEAAELREFAQGDDPDTGRPFGARPARILELYLEQNVPSPNEALITFVNGEPFLRSRQVVPYSSTPTRRSWRAGRPCSSRSVGKWIPPPGGSSFSPCRCATTSKRGVSSSRRSSPSACMRSWTPPSQSPRSSGSACSCSARCSRGGSPTGSFAR